MWFVFLVTARSFLGAEGGSPGDIRTPLEGNIANRMRDLAKHPPSVLDRYLPWLFTQVERGYALKQASRDAATRTPEKTRLLANYRSIFNGNVEVWRELRHWLIQARPDLADKTLESAISDAYEWSEHQVEVGGGGPLAENLHERLPVATLDLGKGWVWRAEGHPDVWQAIGRELGHCYKHAHILKNYLNGLMWVLVGPKGKPHVTVTVSDCELEAKGLRNQLPMFRYHKAVWDLFVATTIWHELAPLDGCDPGEPIPDLEAITILPPKSFLDSDLWLNPEGLGLRDGIDRWRKARDVLADIPDAFPKAFWRYIDAVEAFSRWAVNTEMDDLYAATAVSAGPHTARPESWVVTVSQGGVRTDYAVDASSQARFVKSVRKFVGVR